MSQIDRWLKKKTDIKDNKAPRSIQETMPLLDITDDGIIEVAKNKYSKSFAFSDINYATCTEREKENIFLAYQNIISSLSDKIEAKITIANRKLNAATLSRDVLLSDKNDGFGLYRHEWNNMIKTAATNNNSMLQDKYITITGKYKTADDARTYFASLYADLQVKFKTLGCALTPLNAGERLSLLHAFYRQNLGEAYAYDLAEGKKRGHDARDYICPDNMEQYSDYFIVGKKYGRALMIKDFANYLNDDTIQLLTDLPFNMLLSMDIIPVPMDIAVKETERVLLGVESSINKWQQKQNANGNYVSDVPFDRQQQLNEVKDFLNDLTTRDQSWLFATFSIVLFADDKEGLDARTESIKSIAAQRMCQLMTLTHRQIDGLNTALPFGVNTLQNYRTLTSEAFSAAIPFKVQNVSHANGGYYGINTISRDLIRINREALLNGNEFILGVSGGGKSFAAKEDIVQVMLNTEADIIIIDPEREYGEMVKQLGGEVVHISSTSPHHINAMDINADYSEGANPIIEKSEFIMSLYERAVNRSLLGIEHSLIDRCCSQVYTPYIQGGYRGECPTLVNLCECLRDQPEKEAAEIALQLEVYATGSLSTFAKQTNVDTENRLICYDILDLGSQLLPMGMLVMLDNVLNRVTMNRNAGKRTYVFIDEIYLMFQHQYSADFLYKLWKRIRKYGGYAIGITQNVGDMLETERGAAMLANSEFIILLNQAERDQEALQELLGISDDLIKYVNNTGAGHGLIKVGPNIVPFENKFPSDTQLYKLMTTKFGE